MRSVRNYPLEVSEYQATLKCQDCEIFIGVGHHDASPLATDDGRGPFCRACYFAELRRQKPGWRSVHWTD